MEMAIGNLITTAEAAEIIGVSKARVLQFVQDGRIKVKESVGSNYLFDARQIQSFAAKERKNGRPAVA
jgi:excisionase family DNA binding protein